MDPLLEILAATDLVAAAEPRTKELWAQYMHAVPIVPPAKLTRADYTSLDPDARLNYDRKRMACHSAGVVVTTQDTARIARTVLQTLALNRSAPAGAKRGIVIDGPPTVGKSTLVKGVARSFEAALRDHHPDRFLGTNDEYIPVVYMSVPANATPKSLSAAFAEYLGLPVSRSRIKSGNLGDITTIVLRAFERCRTELVIVDDVHFLDSSQKEGKVSNDHLKNLANFCPATFVFVGVDVEAGGLFSEGRGPSRQTQTAGRFAVHRMDYMLIGTREEQVAWARVIRSFEEGFRLLDHEAGTLARSEWRYLHARTGGRMASLSALLRQAAITAQITGFERIDRHLLDQTITDVATQRNYEKSQATQNRRAKNRSKRIA